MKSTAHSTAIPARIAVAVSGSGRSLENFLATSSLDTPYTVSAVIASNADCRGVDIARKHHLPLFIGDFVRKPSETAAELSHWLSSQQINWIVLAGFLKPFPVLEPWRQRIVNIHPALLPEFGGKGMYGDRVHAAVLAAGKTKSGATIHFVNAHYDEGASIAQVTVPVLPTDDPHTLAARVFAAECKLYPKVLSRLVEGTLPNTDGSMETYSHDQL